MAYITYLVNPDQHTNTWDSHPGYGETKEESQVNARYHANQLPLVRTVPASKAPTWAQREARTTRELELRGICLYGYDLEGIPREPTEAERTEYEELAFARLTLT